MGILLDKKTKIVIQGITGREASMVVKHMRAYGTEVWAGVSPGKGGEKIYGIPVYDSLKQACHRHELNTAIIYVPPLFVYDAVLEAVYNGVKLILIITENVPRQDVIKMLYLAKKEGIEIVGPNSVGIINPGERVKLGPIGGDNVERCFVPGCVGVISRSGGMTAETSWMVKKAGFGVSTAISIGGDPIIGTHPKELLELFEKDEQTKAVVTFSEPGTTLEEDMADFIEAGNFKKPLISFVAGQFTENMPAGTVFGHAGAIIEGGSGKPSTKIMKLKGVGAHIANHYDDIMGLLQRAIKN